MPGRRITLRKRETQFGFRIRILSSVFSSFSVLNSFSPLRASLYAPITSLSAVISRRFSSGSPTLIRT
jgi:hypothetical protein